ncbi:dimethylargininase [Actinophytocola algeriensis]|uniref:Dimethylargininase n=1 Tax=Actinophytocola algeriensis TaxID=1768010 RepID=A0A7W7QA55_9PSEU|nr:dimethylargininase [Actinophytocola algeriensis]MBB4909819.1 dimethylargininase [Actinophytocola algeriensis]MBE1475809.1 dimethylargininase [Actinophytocola algeriensis]
MSITVLVRRPGPRLAEGLISHIERLPVDPALASRQWESYVEALEAEGWHVVEVEPADDCPDAVFVEDPVVVYGKTAVLARSGAPERRGETDGVAAALDGYDIRRIEAPGTLDGGDVLKIGETIYVGRGDRTNDEGIRQLAAHLPEATVVPVPVTKVLHLKSAVTALPDGTVIGYPPLVDDPTVFDRFEPVPEEGGSHVVLLGGNRVLMAASAPESAALFRARGLEPVVVDISEFEKLEGCVTCLSVRLRDTAALP